MSKQIEDNIYREENAFSLSVFYFFPPLFYKPLEEILSNKKFWSKIEYLSKLSQIVFEFSYFPSSRKYFFLVFLIKNALRLYNILKGAERWPQHDIWMLCTFSSQNEDTFASQKYRICTLKLHGVPEGLLRPLSCNSVNCLIKINV